MSILSFSPNLKDLFGDDRPSFSSLTVNKDSLGCPVRLEGTSHTWTSAASSSHVGICEKDNCRTLEDSVGSMFQVDVSNNELPYVYASTSTKVAKRRVVRRFVGGPSNICHQYQERPESTEKQLQVLQCLVCAAQRVFSAGDWASELTRCDRGSRLSKVWACFPPHFWRAPGTGFPLCYLWTSQVDELLTYIQHVCNLFKYGPWNARW